jgi:hypothetical protein
MRRVTRPPDAAQDLVHILGGATPSQISDRPQRSLKSISGVFSRRDYFVLAETRSNSGYLLSDRVLLSDMD